MKIALRIKDINDWFKIPRDLSVKKSYWDQWSNHILTININYGFFKHYVQEFKDHYAYTITSFVRSLVEDLHISLGSVSHILSEILGFRTLYAQWVMHSLAMEQKHFRMRISHQQRLESFKKDKVNLRVDYGWDLGLLPWSWIKTRG